MLIERLSLVMHFLYCLVDTEYSQNHLIKPPFFSLLMGVEPLHDVIGINHLQCLSKLLTGR